MELCAEACQEACVWVACLMVGFADEFEELDFLAKVCHQR